MRTCTVPSNYCMPTSDVYKSLVYTASYSGSESGLGKSKVGMDTPNPDSNQD